MSVPIATPGSLVVVEALVPAVVFAPGGVDDILAKLKAEALAERTDISTPAGRKAVAALAYKIARSKTALDDMGKALVSDLKAQSGAIDAERRRIREDLDALRDAVRKPLTEYEEAEKARIDAHEAALATIKEDPSYGQKETASDIEARLVSLRSPSARDWQEFAARAAEATAAEISRCERLHETALAREAEAAELARLRQAAAERAAAEAAAEVEREMKAREAAAAARAKAEAEAAAARAIAEANAEKERAETARQNAERAARESAEAAERNRIEATAQAERDQLAAVEAERKRAADQEARAKAEASKREADVNHRRAVNRGAADAFVAAGLSEGAAVAAVKAIAMGSVPRVTISY